MVTGEDPLGACGEGFALSDGEFVWRVASVEPSLQTFCRPYTHVVVVEACTGRNKHPQRHTHTHKSRHTLTASHCVSKKKAKTNYTTHCCHDRC